MRLRLSIVIAALILWSLFSFSLADSIFSPYRACGSLLRTIPPGGWPSPPPPLTQAEMDTMMGDCDLPSLTTLMIVGVGYAVILGVGWRYVTARKREVSVDP